MKESDWWRFPLGIAALLEFIEHVRDFLQSCGCRLSSSVFQVGNITQSDVDLVRDVQLRFTAPLAKDETADMEFADGAAGYAP